MAMCCEGVSQAGNHTMDNQKAMSYLRFYATEITALMRESLLMQIMETKSVFDFVGASDSVNDHQNETYETL